VNRYTVVKPFMEMIEGVIGVDETGVAKVTTIGRLPSGAVVTMVNVEVATAFDASTTAKVGVTSDDDIFISAGNLATAGNVASTKVTATTKAEELIVTVNQASTAGSAIVRVQFYLPTTENRSY
jgi:hypothetical protein